MENRKGMEPGIEGLVVRSDTPFEFLQSITVKSVPNAERLLSFFVWLVAMISNDLLALWHLRFEFRLVDLVVTIASMAGTVCPNNLVVADCNCNFAGETGAFELAGAPSRTWLLVWLIDPKLDSIH